MVSCWDKLTMKARRPMIFKDLFKSSNLVNVSMGVCYKLATLSTVIANTVNSLLIFITFAHFHLNVHPLIPRRRRRRWRRKRWSRDGQAAQKLKKFWIQPSSFELDAQTWIRFNVKLVIRPRISLFLALFLTFIKVENEIYT